MTTKANNTSVRSNDWHIVASGDWLSGQRFTINQHAVLGRDSSCDITIPGTHLSRRHAELAVTGDKLLVRDLGSSNGTFVNEKQITEAELKAGDEIRFDVLTFKVEGPATQNTDTTLARPAHTPKPRPSTHKPRTAAEKKWQSKPTSAGNRDKTVQMSTAQKAAGPLWNLLAAVVGLGALATVVYLFLQL